MAKSDLLKEAIADAKAVKETALANAKIALEEAFAPRIQSMLTTKLAEDEMYEDEMYEDEMLDIAEEEPDVDPMAMEGEMDLEAELGGEAPMDDLGAAGMEDDLGAEAGMEDDLGAAEGPASVNIDGVEYAPVGGDDTSVEADAEEMAPPVDDMELESIIRELEEDLNEEDNLDAVDAEIEVNEGVTGAEALAPEDENLSEDFNIDEIIESILSEEEDAEAPKDEADAELDEGEYKEELEEAYNTIHSLRHTINEVNLLNAKLLYTNKLFRNFELNENQKMKVIENFDRAGTTREVKLVFSTLAESFTVPVKKRKMVKENKASKSYASRPSGTTAPSKKTKQIINEGNELANRWKKLAGLLPN